MLPPSHPLLILLPTLYLVAASQSHADHPIHAPSLDGTLLPMNDEFLGEEFVPLDDSEGPIDMKNVPSLSGQEGPINQKSPLQIYAKKRHSHRRHGNKGRGPQLPTNPTTAVVPQAIAITKGTASSSPPTRLSGSEREENADPAHTPASPAMAASDEDVMELFRQDQALIADASTPIHPKAGRPGRSSSATPLTIPPIPADRSSWVSPLFPAATEANGRAVAPVAWFAESWNTTKEAYGQENRQWALDPVDPSLTALQVTYPAGSSNPGGEIVGGTGLYAQPLHYRPDRPSWMQYQVYFPQDFDFVKGGKLPGLFAGHPSCSGGSSSEDCFSA
ncbi:hypothetical protein BJ684DRAFT_18151, partial [Piptocephalis cylindrospora]